MRKWSNTFFFRKAKHEEIEQKEPTEKKVDQNLRNFQHLFFIRKAKHEKMEQTSHMARPGSVNRTTRGRCGWHNAHKSRNSGQVASSEKGAERRVRTSRGSEGADRHDTEPSELQRALREIISKTRLARGAQGEALGRMDRLRGWCGRSSTAERRWKRSWCGRSSTTERRWKRKPGRPGQVRLRTREE